MCMLHLLIIFSINYTVLWLGQTDSWGNFSDCSGDWVPGVHPVYVNTWILNIICTRHSHCSFQTFCNNSVAYEERIFIKSAEFLETNGFYSLKLQVTVCTKRWCSSRHQQFVTSLTHFSITWRLNNIGMNRSSKIYNG